MTESQYVFDILSDVPQQVNEFLSYRDQFQFKPRLRLSEIKIEYEHNKASFSIHRDADPHNVLTIYLTFNHEYDVLYQFTFGDIQWRTSNWWDAIGEFFESSLLPNYYGFHPNYFRTMEELQNGASNQLLPHQGEKVMDMWFSLERHEPTSCQELIGSLYCNQRKVKSLFNLCFYQLSSKEQHFLREYQL